MATHTLDPRVASGHFRDRDRDNMNSALRGELSAVETYEQALTKFDDMDTRSVLSHIRDEHVQAVGLLRNHIRDMGGEPSESSGAWGTMVGAITGTAKILGPQTVLGALKQGEEVGIGTYEGILNDKETPTECRDFIRDDLMPRCRDHIRALDSMILSLEAKE